jgi:hypothetical protein
LGTVSTPEGVVISTVGELTIAGISGVVAQSQNGMRKELAASWYVWYSAPVYFCATVWIMLHRTC